MQQQRIVTLMKPENVSRRNNNKNKGQQQQSQYVLYLSLSMLVGSLITCTSLSFCLGRWTRSIITMINGPVETTTTTITNRINIDMDADDSSCRSCHGNFQPTHLDNASFLVDINVQESPSSSLLYHMNKSSPPPLLDYGRTSNHQQRRIDIVMEQTTFLQDDYYDQQESILYHEALIHPAMLAHPNPCRVLLAIVVSSDEMDVAINEVFKHNTVQHVTVIQHVGGGNNSSSNRRSSRHDTTSSYYFDDDRVEIIQADAVDWVVHHFSQKELEDDEAENKYDVIILDSTSRRHDMSTPMFSFNKADDDDVFDALTSEGVLVAHVGPMDKGRDAALDLNPNRRERVALTRVLEHLGELEVLESVKIYTQSSLRLSDGGGGGGWTFMVAFRDYVTLTRWFANQAEIDLQLAARTIMSSDAHGMTFRYFDGATMESYQYPSRIAEDVFCRTHHHHHNPSYTGSVLCAHGHGFDPNVHNAPISSFEVRPSLIEGAGRGVFLKESVQQGTYIAIDHGVHSMFVMPSTNVLVTQMQNQTNSSNGGSDSGGSYGDLWIPLLFYMHGYGFDTDYFGEDCTIVDAGILTFANHGCNGTYNMGQSLSITEMTADAGNQPPPELLEDEKSTIYDVFYDRSHWIYESASDVMRVDVSAGSELLDNYLPFYVDWGEGVRDLRSQCQGQSVGLVVAYETAESSK